MADNRRGGRNAEEQSARLAGSESVAVIRICIPDDFFLSS